MKQILRFSPVPIDEIRDFIIGTEITDIEEEGRVIYVKDKTGRSYCLDTTSSEGVFAHANSTTDEELVNMKELFNALLEKLDIDEEELYKLIYG